MVSRRRSCFKNESHWLWPRLSDRRPVERSSFLEKKLAWEPHQAPTWPRKGLRAAFGARILAKNRQNGLTSMKIWCSTWAHHQEGLHRLLHRPLLASICPFQAPTCTGEPLDRSPQGSLDPSEISRGACLQSKSHRSELRRLRPRCRMASRRPPGRGGAS